MPGAGQENNTGFGIEMDRYLRSFTGQAARLTVACAGLRSVSPEFVEGFYRSPVRKELFDKFTTNGTLRVLSQVTGRSAVQGRAADIS